MTTGTETPRLAAAPEAPVVAGTVSDFGLQPRLRKVQCLGSRGLHRVAYWEWGDPANPRVLVCGHGLTRQGRDFDTLARELCGTWRVVCPDVVGRGQPV